MYNTCIDFINGNSIRHSRYQHIRSYVRAETCIQRHIRTDGGIIRGFDECLSVKRGYYYLSSPRQILSFFLLLSKLPGPRMYTK